MRLDVREPEPALLVKADDSEGIVSKSTSIACGGKTGPVEEVFHHIVGGLPADPYL